MMSLRTFLPLFLLLILVAGSTLNATFKYFESLKTIQSDAIHQLRTVGTLISAGVETGIRYGNLAIVNSAIEQSQSSDIIRYSFLTNKDSVIATANIRLLEGKHISDIDDKIISGFLSSLDRKYYLLSIPEMPEWIIYQLPLSQQTEANEVGRLIDRLILVANISHQLNTAKTNVMYDIGGWIFFSTITALILWLVLQQTVVGPVNYLKILSQKIAADDKDIKQKQGLMREFSQLDNALRDMADKLSVSQLNYRELYDKNPTIFLIIDKEGMLLNINSFGLESLELTKHEAIGKPASDLYHEEDRIIFTKNINQLFKNPAVIGHWELRHNTHNNDTNWYKDDARVIQYQGETVALVVSQDVNDLYQMSRILSFQASHDALTGLINRSQFSKLLKESVTKARTNSESHCLCFLDLDQFKIVNDVCGHVAGDELLQQISKMLKQTLRKGDVLARIGGDEFGLLLECCDPDKAIDIVQNLRKELANSRFSWENKYFEIGISAGISVIDKNTRNIQIVLSEADSACYTAKDLGRNQTIVYNAKNKVSSNLLGEMRWVNRINQAIENDNEFELYFQKIVGLNSKNKNEFKGEILIRLKEKDGSITSPGVFLPAAERYNIAYKIDLWVVKQTLERAISHEQHFPDDWMISINLSAQTISNTHYSDPIYSLLQQYKDVCPHLCFEVTETAAIASFAKAIEFMKKIQSLGCLLSLDDFGSGFSSFGYLKIMPVQYLKIDGMFIRELATNNVDIALVSAMNDIAHSLNKHTVAEFVENELSYDKLSEIKVDYAQGYYLHVPEPFENILTSLTTNIDMKVVK